MTQASYPRQGGCTCGAIRYQLESEPLIVQCCHCHWCQRETGTAFAHNAMIEADRVTLLQGEPVAVLTPSDSGKGQKVWRCKDCQIALWGNYAAAGDAVRFVRVGTLDDPNALPPAIHVFTASKQDWVLIPEGHLAFEVYYDREEHWPEDSLLRRKQLLEQQAAAQD